MIAYIAVPAMVALVFKAVLLGYAVRSPISNERTRLFLALLIALAAHNLSEVLALTYFTNFGLTSTMQVLGFAYVGLLIPVIALILHVSLRLSFDWRPSDPHLRMQPLLYLPGAILLCLLLFTDKLVLGFRPFQNTVLRVPGQWYFLFEIYFEVYLLVAISSLFYGSRPSRPSTVARTCNRLWLVAILPTVLLCVYLIVANHFGWTKITSTIYVPITLTFFIILASYATNEYRPSDVQYYIPWSKVRKHKNVFYERIQAIIKELADMRTVDEAMSRVSGLLRCSVALVGGWRPVLAMAGDRSIQLAQFPHERLEKIDHILVAHEIEQAMPDMHQVMKQFGVAVIVPFYPHAKTAASWMLLGDSFSDSVYTSRDFKKVERLFDNLGEFFLDKLTYLRTELTQAKDRNQSLQEKVAVLKSESAKARDESLALRDYNFRLQLENHSLRMTVRPSQPGQLLRLVPKTQPEDNRPLADKLAEYEAHLIQQALRRCNHNKSEAARQLGMRPNTLHYKIERYRLTDKDDD
ncbi:MAG: hypothetical protein HY308_00295 [Gammaproteobacteria bacterium]|nr:hypothetical protein [Gammaproteobacteria bacterium]